MPAPRSRLAGNVSPNECGTGGPGDPAGRVEAVGPQGPPTQQERGPLARPQGLGHLVDGVGGDDGAPRQGPGCVGSGGRLGPRGVGRQHQRGHAPGWPVGRGHGVDRVARHVVGPRGRAVPARDRPGDGRDVGLERGVVASVVGGVVAHDVDDRGAGAPGVVQVGQAVAEPRPEVEQGGGRLAPPPCRSRRRRR